MGEAAFGRLVAALSLCVGIESLVVLHDICEIGPREAEQVKSWAAQRLLDAALAGNAAHAAAPEAQG